MLRILACWNEVEAIKSSALCWWKKAIKQQLADVHIDDCFSLFQTPHSFGGRWRLRVCYYNGPHMACVCWWQLPLLLKYSTYWSINSFIFILLSHEFIKYCAAKQKYQKNYKTTRERIFKEDLKLLIPKSSIEEINSIHLK